jgi:hypothetical protein
LAGIKIRKIELAVVSDYQLNAFGDVLLKGLPKLAVGSG